MKLLDSTDTRCSMSNGLPVGQAGFTLIEIVIVMAIVAILTAIAVPSYTAYILRSNRSEARAQMLMAAQWMERVRNESGRYDLMGGLPVALPAGLNQSPQVGAPKYTLALGNLTPGTYTITATGVGTMAADVCSTLIVNQVGVRTSAPGAFDLCWGR